MPLKTIITAQRTTLVPSPPLATLKRSMHTANNKKWYVRNKRLLAENYYYHHAVPQKIWITHQLARGKSKNQISLQQNEYITPTPHVLNPLTSPFFRTISYLHVIGPREQTATKVIKKGFQTSNEDAEAHRIEHETQTSTDSAGEDINSLREQERLMELDLSASAIRNANRQTVESHQHLLYAKSLPTTEPVRSFVSLHNPEKRGLINPRLTRSFFTAFISKLSTHVNSNTNTNTNTDERHAKSDRIEKASHKLEGISKESDMTRNHLREKSFESDEAGLVEDEQRLQELDISASAVREELKENGAYANEEFATASDETETSSKFQARAYEDLEENLSQTIIDEESETISSHNSKY